MTRILVIGGNGIIGHFVTRRLVAAGHRPVVMSRSADTALIRDVVDGCDIVRGDVTDAGRVDTVIRDHAVTHVAHLGAVLPSVAEHDPALGVRANVEGTANVLAAAVRHGVRRVVFASSKAIYGPVRGRFGLPAFEPIPEDAVPAPATVYGISKVAAEELGRWHARRFGIEFAALRFGATIGPGKIGRHGGSFGRFSRIIEGAMSGRPVTIESGGDAISDPIYNDDAARGIVAALEAPRLAHGAYNIASGRGITLHDLADAARRVFPSAEISIGPGDGDPASTNGVFDVTRARQDLGFVAGADLDEIVRAYASAMHRLGIAPVGSLDQDSSPEPRRDA